MASTDGPQPPPVPFGDRDVQYETFPPLDPSLYALSPAEAAFFKAATGIDDDRSAQGPYLHGSGESIQGREREDAIFLDVGCCFSVDSRKAAADGFPACNIVASDLIPEFLELSHALFNTSKDTYPGHFVAGDIFDPVVLSVEPHSGAVPPSPRPDLSALASLNHLRGHCSVIHAAAFFHLFTEEKQLHAARALAGLLSSEPGSLICGVQKGAQEPGIVTNYILGGKFDFFCHSPNSWEAMWNKVFTMGEVKVEASLRTFVAMKRETSMLSWSVTRL
ncbi:hypothetical protein BU15DRAFT_74166 [Melanogaster broomeanus]|nr:hypothetical protein BU15DRAFT_74166 [Melanogaster broomeanus]